MNMYPRFGAMIATSTVVMLGLMYLHTYQLSQLSRPKESNGFPVR
jgi:hypothetical protein